MISDDEDSIFTQSVFDDSSEHSIVAGDLVWAELECGTHWPAQVQHTKDSDICVKLLGKDCSLTVQSCTPYVPNPLYEVKGCQQEGWREGIKELEEQHSLILEEAEKDGLFSVCNTNSCTREQPSRKYPSRKRRKLSGGSCSQNGFIVGDIVWAKYRSHPTWPAQVSSISKKDIRLRYFGFEGTSVRAIPKNVEKFDCPEYHNHVDAGINSNMSHDFKQSYTLAFKAYLLDTEHPNLSLIQLDLDDHQKAPVSPMKGKNQLVFFINKSEDMFCKIATGKLVGHWHTQFKSNMKPSDTNFGSFAKTELEEERVLQAITEMQQKLNKRRFKLSHSYGINVMLPEAITRLLMKKHACSYSKAREMFAKDCEKMKKVDKARVRRDLLTTKISDEDRADIEELRSAQVDQLRSQMKKNAKATLKKR